MEFVVIVCVIALVVSLINEDYGWSIWFALLGSVLLGLVIFAPVSSKYRLVTCTNSEDVVIKTMTGRVTTYKGSNYVSNDTETYIIPPGASCTESPIPK
jgi:hypothetical protein